MRGLDPRIHLRIELRFRAMDCRHRRAEATPSFGRLCPAMTLMLRIAIHIQLSNSERVCVRILAARCARALRRLPPSERRGRRESRVHAAPAVSRANCTKKRTRAYRFSGGNPAFPARWFTAYFALSPVTGLSCHRHPREDLLPANLTPASGCQDHTASPSANNSIRHSPPSRPPHPTARS
jgi:hypothetical protein